MKREILFRGQSKNNQWVEGSLILSGELHFIHVVKKDEFGNIISEFDVEVIPETVGQFTGLCDKNGKKIFEGDICKYFQPYSKRTDIHIVLWDEKFAGFGMFEPDSEWSKESDWLKIQDIEVIGNIHDNPELLNE